MIQQHNKPNQNKTKQNKTKQGKNSPILAKQNENNIT